MLKMLQVRLQHYVNCELILKEISPEISLEGMMLKLKLQCFGHSCEELTYWKILSCYEGTGEEGDDRG